MELQKNGQPKQTQRRMSAAQKRKFTALAGLVLLCAIFIIGIFYSSVYRYVHKMESNQIEQNVKVQGIDVSGLTEKQALEKLETRWTVMKHTPILLKAGDKTAQVTVSELGILPGDMEKLVEEAVEYGKKGSLMQRYRKIRQARKEGIVYEADYQIDREQADAVLKEKTEDFFEAAVDAKITRVGGVFQITDEEDGEKASVEDAVDAIMETLEDPEKGKEVQIKVDSEEEEAKIRREDLEKVETSLGHAAVSVSGTGKSQEVLGLAGKLNGQIVLPEEEYSLQTQLADAVETGSFEESLNLIASAVYQAALYAEVEIVERHEAERMPEYVEAGMEAILSAGEDFKFRNDTESPLYIEAYVNDKEELVCTIYGKETRAQERKLVFEREIRDEKAENVIYKEDHALQAGKTRVIIDGSPKCTVVLWKEIEEDGEQTKEEMDTSEYEAVNSVIYVGVKTGKEAVSKSLKEAIATQDPSVIEKAVAQVHQG